MHDPVDPNVRFPALEEAVLERWRKDDIIAKSLARHEGAEEYVFYEGPPTANNKPGVHHVLARAFKDIYPRFWSMRGRYVPRKAGWDCHGLPVEIEVEKKLGFTRKQQIVDHGIDRFNELCRGSVKEYVDEWERFSERMGFWLDYDDAYWTMSSPYIESVWWSLAELHGKGLLFEDDKVTPYCPRCETPLSDHELGQEDVYIDVDDPGVTLALPLRDEPGLALAIWTTTPWTLISNLAVAVHPDIRYAVASVDGRRLVYAEALVPEGAVVERTVPGSELVGRTYEPPFDFTSGTVPGAWRVLAADFVSAEDGTGLVHLAPAFGADDRDACREAGIGTFNPVDRSGRFDERVPRWLGRFVKDADREIVEDLSARGLLVADERYVHSYPHCWRCRSPLLYYAIGSWYVRTTASRERLLEVNRNVNWVPEHIRDGRYGRWLENNVDWSLSRFRFWGTPLPIWRCAQRHETAVGSRARLGELAGRDLSDLDLHRPHVDEVTFACPECGEEARRVPDLIDVWYDSGAMPFAQYGYPHTEGSDELFERRFPAEFISEAIDQTRGWFYTLMAESVLLFDDTSYRNVVCLGHITDGEGRKMSKSLGNVIDPWDEFSRSGADALRFLFFTGSAPGDNKRVTWEALDQVVKGPFLTLWNSYRFYVQYANVDGFDPNTWTPMAPNLRPPLDRWLLSELHQTITEVTEALEEYDCTRAGRRIADLVDDLSNWYVRRSRRRFWREASDDEGEADKSSAYWTLWTTLVEISKLLAPFTPFLADELYRNLVGSVNPDAAPSVHLTDWPHADHAQVEPALAEAMAVARELVSLGRQARSAAGIKVRQPLSKAVLLVPPDYELLLDDVGDLIADELNVDEVVLAEEGDALVRVTLKPNFRTAGPELGPRVRDLTDALASIGPDEMLEVAQELEAGEEIEFELEDGEVLTVLAEHVEIRREPAEGTAFAYEAPFGVSLDLEITPELRAEGIARELVHQLQQLRREMGLEVTDRIALVIGGSAEVVDACRASEDYVADELLAEDIAYQDGGDRELTVEGQTVRVRITKLADEGEA